MVKNIWIHDVDEEDNAKIIAAKFKRLRKGLKIWARGISDLKKIINGTNCLILCDDTLEEYRELTIEEYNGRNILKSHLDKILEHERIDRHHVALANKPVQNHLRMNAIVFSS